MTREQRREQLEQLDYFELKEVWHDTTGNPRGTVPPSGLLKSSLIDQILDAEFPAGDSTQ